MSMKSRLFASVAAPVLSLPLIIQPVHAGPVGLNMPAAPVQTSTVIQVQEQPAGEGAEEIIPRRERRENAEEQQGERPSRREQRAQDGEGEGGERPQRRERQAEEPQQERPRREERAAEPEAERPRQRAEQAEEQAPERPRREQNREQRREKAEQPPEQKAPEPAPEQQAEQPQAERPPQAERQAEEPQRERPRRERQNAEQPAEASPSQQAEEPAARPEPTPRSAEQPAAEQPAGERTAGERPAGERPDGQRPRQREQQAGDSEATPRPPRQQARDGQAPAQPEGQASEQPATSGGERPDARPVEQTAEQPMLPVENGAAVLDSAKEQRPDRAPRDGDRPRRDPNRAQGGQQAQEQAAPPPRNDAEAQANERITSEQREQWRRDRRELVEERGERMDGRPEFEQPRGWDVRGPVAGGDRDQGRNGDRDRDRNRDRDRDGGRVIISIDNQTYVRHNDSRRLYEDGRRPEYERLGDGRYREVVERSDGTRVVTIRNRYGEVVQRSRIVRGGEEYVLYYAPELLEDRRDYTWRDPGDDLPPMRLTVPVDDYIIDTSSEPDRDYYEFLEQPPVERVERPYSLDEVRYSARIRDKVPRIDLDTITFATGSAEIPMNQARSLRKVADAINQVLEKDPSETFLIEGHTDAVGSDESNLILSDERAESVAVVLSDAFGIPPENLTTQGYGEQYLKVNTEAANQENRRVTIRRITPLVKPVASNQ